MKRNILIIAAILISSLVSFQSINGKNTANPQIGTEEITPANENIVVVETNSTPDSRDFMMTTD